MTDAEWAVYEAEQVALRKRVEQAMWDGDTDLLNEIAHCECCCSDHTFESCLARLWGACRGQGSLTRADIEGWAKHYGMTREEFGA